MVKQKDQENMTKQKGNEQLQNKRPESQIKKRSTSMTQQSRVTFKLDVKEQAKIEEPIKTKVLPQQSVEVNVIEQPKHQQQVKKMPQQLTGQSNTSLRKPISNDQLDQQSSQIQSVKPKNVDNSNTQAPIKQNLKKDKKEQSPKFIDKHLKISDFINYIIVHQEVFMSEIFSHFLVKDNNDSLNSMDQHNNINNKRKLNDDQQKQMSNEQKSNLSQQNNSKYEQNQTFNHMKLRKQDKLFDFVSTFLIEVQDSMDYDRSMKIFIEQDIYQNLIQQLYDQSKDSIIHSNIDIYDPNKQQHTITRGIGRIPAEIQGIYRKYARIGMLIELINQSVLENRYDIAYEITRKFIEDLLKAEQLPIFDSMLINLKISTSFYEAKIALLLNCIPVMGRNTAGSIMKIIEEHLNGPATNSILTKNLNPLRVGLMLYRLIDTIQYQFSYSNHGSNQMKETLQDQLKNLLEMYNDPNELMVLVEQTDYEGNNCFWYFDEYDNYKILDSRIMSQVILKKLYGKFETNAEIDDLSTAYDLLTDEHELYITDILFTKLMQNLKEKMLETRHVHRYKFDVWRHSIHLRLRIDFITTLTLCTAQQVLLKYFLDSFKIVREDYQNEKIINIKEYQNTIFWLEDFKWTCILYLMFPLNQFMLWFFIKQTKRKFPDIINVSMLIELGLFVATIILYYVYWVDIDLSHRLSSYSQQELKDYKDLSQSERMIVNIIILQDDKELELTHALGIISMLFWMKLFLRLQVQPIFGPFFKVIGRMLIDLGKFLVIWIVMILIFASGAMMFFNPIKKYPSFFRTFLLLFYYSLGDWDKELYCPIDEFIETSGSRFEIIQEQDNDSNILCNFGQFFILFVLLINTVVLLNLVIAIFSSTYAYFEEKQLGLYYEVLVSKIDQLEYNKYHGAIICAQPPVNLIIAPFWLVSLLPCFESIRDKYQKQFNLLMCHIVYLPVAVIVVCWFMVKNAIYTVLAYIKHVYVLIDSLTQDNKKMDESQEKLERVKTILRFIAIGPFFLTAAFFFNLSVFIGDLYIKPNSTGQVKINNLIRSQTLKMFEQTCIEQLNEFRKHPNYKKGKTLVPFVDLVKRLQIKLDIAGQIHKILFEDLHVDKFQKDQSTGTQKLKGDYQRGLGEFILLKNLVARSADKTDMVDTHLLIDFLKQVDLRVKMLKIEMDYFYMESKSEDKLLNLSIYELTKKDPSTAINMLSEEAQVLDIVAEQVATLQEDMYQMKISMKTMKEEQALHSQSIDTKMDQIILMQQYIVANMNTSDQKSNSNTRLWLHS